MIDKSQQDLESCLKPGVTLDSKHGKSGSVKIAPPVTVRPSATVEDESEDSLGDVSVVQVSRNV